MNRFLFCSVVLAVSLCGCNAGASATPLGELIPVKGKVTFRGKPLTKGVVEFEPKDSGRRATGDIGPDGAFVLGSIKEGDGATAGVHRVSITEVEFSPDGTRLPVKYRQPNTSGLEATVSPENNEFTFDLK
jgi:hypothetical protein